MTVARDLAGGPARRVRASGWSRPGPAPRGRTRGEADIELILAPPSMWRLPAALITETKAAGAGGSDCTPRGAEGLCGRPSRCRYPYTPFQPAIHSGRVVS